MYLRLGRYPYLSAIQLIVLQTLQSDVNLSHFVFSSATSIYVDGNTTY